MTEADHGTTESTPGGGERTPGPAEEHPHLVETIAERRTVFEGGYLSLDVATIVDADGRRHEREIVGHPGAVAVVALDGEELLLVRQYRSAAGEVLLEIPAGTLDRATDGAIEPPDEAIVRELAEETGMRAREWRRLGSFWTAPGFATEEMHLYLARGLEPIGGYTGPPPGERIDLVRVPWREVLAMADRGELRDAKTIIAILWLARLLG
ncbi:MAG TPA: NUDIX hydrolase [Candidatus Limnocylindrales bacterium]|jgi:ADP-ribose pyrophosphatase|nr:NUDIX hydrolase [Candidatus Limnocylindrales bacterium]